MIEKCNIKKIHTLGPEGTNSEIAAWEWFRQNRLDGEVILYRKIEDALDIIIQDVHSALLVCIVYPNLHHLIFENINRIELFDCIITDTHEMVYASNNSDDPGTIVTHPAPEKLVPADKKILFTTSNAQAAIDCKNALADGCITTSVCAAKHQLKILKNFSRLKMGYALYAGKI
jgi:prephenate dehydratase